MRVAAFAFALSFGVLARTSGMGWAAPLVMSATTFSGAAQFAVASILHDKGSAAAAILAAGMLSARYIPIGISIATSFTGSTLRRFLQSQCVVDETWAVALNRPGGFDVRVLVGAGGALYIAWNAGTAVGLVLGNVIGDANRLGLDAAFPALFLALLIPQLSNNRKLRRGAPRRRHRAGPDPLHACRRPHRRGFRRLPRRLAERVSAVWLSVIVVGAATIVFKATGPVLLGRGRELPPWLAGPVSYLAPAVLAALVVTQAVAGHREIVFDARLAGLGAGAIAVALRAPLLVVLVVAAATAALIRLV